MSSLINGVSNLSLEGPSAQTLPLKKEAEKSTASKSEECFASSSLSIAPPPAQFCLPGHVALGFLAPSPSPAAIPSAPYVPVAEAVAPADEAVRKRIEENLTRAQAAASKTYDQAFYDPFLKYRKAPPSFFQAAQVAEGRVGPFRYTKASHWGTCRYMQDRDLVVEFEITVKGQKYSIPLFAVLDGHGARDGERVTEWVQQALPRYLQNSLSKCEDLTDSAIEVALTEAFSDLNKELSKRIDPQSDGGCTATVGLLIQDKLWTANVGDSRIVYLNNGTHITLTHDAKPNDPYFLEMAQKYGAEIAKGKDSGYLSGEDGARLAMVTSFGDFRIPHGCEPTITCIPTPKAGFLVLGCDGIWDVFSSKSMAKKTQDVEPMAQDLVYLAYQGRVHLYKKYSPRHPIEPGDGNIDNLTAIVINFGSLVKPEPKLEYAPSAAPVCAPSRSERDRAEAPVADYAGAPSRSDRDGPSAPPVAPVADYAGASSRSDRDGPSSPVIDYAGEPAPSDRGGPGVPVAEYAGAPYRFERNGPGAPMADY